MSPKISVRYLIQNQGYKLVELVAMDRHTYIRTYENNLTLSWPPKGGQQKTASLAGGYLSGVQIYLASKEKSCPIQIKPGQLKCSMETHEEFLKLCRLRIDSSNSLKNK